MAEVVRAFDEESTAWARVLAALTPAEFGRPTPCPPWTVAELIAHVTAAIARVPDGLAAPSPPRADLDATGYYHPRIFDATANAERVTAAQRAAAAQPDPAALVAAFDRQCRRTLDVVAHQPPGRLVVTRWGDGMALHEFLLTRVVELVLHGLDLAAALDRPIWSTPTAAALVTGFLGVDTAATRLGWDQPTALAKGSGRAPLTPDEEAELARIPLRPFG
ncbi:maleylpyruvate isomerase N-terminal domain-containing protein [Nocardia sp. NPDC050793]|uniref:maleylpyruvate isomerase N-terminal domain-containing protein n=1 Tax=Nocardia sp. NPDC050793 TaxID=3155159 RepID=UPI0033C19290